MVGLSDLWWAYQNSGPLLLFIIAAGGAAVYHWSLRPRLDRMQARLDDLESTQEQRGDRWADHELDARERALLLDEAHETIDQVEDAVERLKMRVRGLEQQFAIEHGEGPEAFEEAGDDR